MSVINELNQGKYALIFGGQGSAWRPIIKELAVGSLEKELEKLNNFVSVALEPVRDQLIVVRPETKDIFSDPSRDKFEDSDAPVSVPGILYSQYLTLRSLMNQGVDVAKFPPVAVEGHSQGVMAKELVEAIKTVDEGERITRLTQIFAIANILGYAAAKMTEDVGIFPEVNATPMVSVKGASRKIIEAVIAKTKDNGGFVNEIAIAIKNDEDHYIISGQASDLEILVQQLEIFAKKYKEMLDAKETGGSELNIQTDFLNVTVPFHSPLLKPALKYVEEWATKCQLDVQLSLELASHVLVNPIDWSASVRSCLTQGAKYFVDLGPTAVVGKLSERLLQGTGAGIIEASNGERLAELVRPGYEPNMLASWESFEPKLVQLPNGKTVVDTAFTRLTGKAPVMLAGMTPTTVEPEIVAAAANAGYWAEVAGGGQVTAEVFNENLSGLEKQLQPGITAQFNSMFLDRYLWNLQFGTTKIVSRARAAGAPLDGVIVTAGIPEKDEAVDLVQTLNKEGFPFVTFKPGTIAQINQVIDIANAVSEYKVIMEIEDGHAGGHHSWESLDDLLLATYPKIRETHNIVLCVGGGIAKPEDATKYLTGEWSIKYTRPKMPVDGVFIGTVAMATKESHATDQVKQLLLETPGISREDVEKGDSWVGSGKSRGQMTSGLSHLRADIYEIDNDSAAAARLIAKYESNADEVESHKNEIIEAINKTAKPYFGDIENMTYLQLVERFAKLCFENVDPKRYEESLVDRFYDILQRIEQRLVDQDSGEFISLFGGVEDVIDYNRAIEQIKQKYPKIATAKVTGIDVAWFIENCRKHPKPVPFVPRVDGDIFRWWGKDSLWQSEDNRYPASSCRIIPGPVSVSGIDRINEPVADLLGRFEKAVSDNLVSKGEAVKPVLSRLGNVDSPEDYIRQFKHISWTNHLIGNPANFLDQSQYDLVKIAENKYDLNINFDTFWDKDFTAQNFHVVHGLTIPLIVPENIANGACPIVDEDRLPKFMYDMLAATAGVGSETTSHDFVSELPKMEKVFKNEIGGVEFNQPNFGRAKYSFHVSENLGPDHASVTGGALDRNFQRAGIVPDAILGMCWPPIYSALGSATIDLGTHKDYPVIEGLLNAVHLDHTIDMVTPLDQLAGKKLNAYAWAEDLKESVSGRIVDIRVVLTVDGTGTSPETEQLAIRFRERFAVQGRASGSNIPEAPKENGGKLNIQEIIPTKRRMLRATRVKAPKNMTPFARVSGDFNPIHTSKNAAQVAGLVGPIVHGMWLSGTAQHFVSSAFEATHGFKISGWTAQWYSPTQLGDTVELTVERTGKIRGGGVILEVIAKIGGELTAKFTATTERPVTAYCYPGQGIQAAGMGLDERALSKAADEVWRRADQHTRKVLGFSIIAIVRDNPRELIANGVHYFHPDGVLNLTQFTQVAIATVGMAQTARLREAGSAVDGAIFAGHSLGEYVALSSYGKVIPIETVLELVFARGSAMHSLVPRNKDGRSNYLMGALRPNQFGISKDKEVEEYVQSIADQTGEFLQIVNYNISGSQYAVAGTVAGLQALRKDAQKRVEEFGGRGAFMFIPGLDVPFHSRVLRDGVPDFREKLMKMLPEDIDYDSLVGRYIPNLVARPFEFTMDFAKSILEVVPSEVIKEITASDMAWQTALADKQKLGRTLLVELLCWQFASPVRWIETQDLMFRATQNGGLGVEQFIEVGLKNSPTLAGMASKTLALPYFARTDVQVYNVQRDEARVYMEDDDSAVDMEAFEDEGLALEKEVEKAANKPVESSPVSTTTSNADSNAAGSTPAPVVEEKAESATPVVAVSTGTAEAVDVPFVASDALKVLFAYANKLTLEQIGANDNAETLTNGVSSRRNQMLMDMSAELGLASIDGAAEAPVSQLYQTVDKLAHNYKPFGPVLGDAIRSHIRKFFGAAGVKQAKIAERVNNAWGLGEGWVSFVTAEILLGTRDGASMRGGNLANLTSTAPSSAGEADAIIDAAVQAIAARRGVAVSLQGAGGAGGGGSMVDSEALDAFANKVIGADGVLAKTARGVLKQLGIKEPKSADLTDELAEAQAVVDAVTAELGNDWFKRVSPTFNANKVVFLDDRWASAKEDLAELYVKTLSNVKEIPEVNYNYLGTGKAVQEAALYWAEKSKTGSASNLSLASTFEKIANEAGSVDNGEFSNDVAIVTGAAPKSIGGAVVAKLLRGGATVIMTASHVNSKRLDFAKDVYRQNASGSAKLYLVPANLSSYRDVDAFIEWVGAELKETVGGKTKITKEALVPTLLFPFAAPGVKGYMSDAGSEAEMETRLLLWTVEKLIAGLGKIGTETDTAHKMHVVLPGSPNRGIFGGDGAYGEVKSAFDAIEKKWGVEKIWSSSITLAHPKIGWVRGTSLMGGNDPLVTAVERAGVRTYSTAEITDELIKLCSKKAREQAKTAPITADLTGGLGTGSINLAELKKEAMADMKKEAEQKAAEEAAAAARTARLGSVGSHARKIVELQALPSISVPELPKFNPSSWSNVSTKLEDMQVIVGIGEIGPWGSGRTRFEAEHGIQSDGSVEMTPAGVLELAWMMDLIHWSDTPNAGWYDEKDNLVHENEIFDRFRDEVVARSGVRQYVDDDPAWIKDLATENDVAIFLDRDITFSVPSQELAQSFVDIDPDKTIIEEDIENGEWKVTKLKGAKTRVARKVAMTRKVGGQIPTNFDPARWGIPASMLESMDRLAVWNLVATVDAFLSSGFTPAELLQYVHPSDVGSTQGTGIGGTDSMRKLFVDNFLGEDTPSDILQEALPNVIAAHVMQSYVGGYGVMVHPVGACATAAVSIEDACDKIQCGKADFVVAGAIDDISIESITGFGDMNATVKTQDLLDKGINERFVSRANDRRRGGFVESEGGGTVLITRGDIAAKMNLPVLGVVGYSRSFADGAHTSIPAPGLGALGAVRGGMNSKFVKQLADLSVTPDDISVISKHDTSTNANDPNESELYTRISAATNRKAGNPLFVISQKTVTGHAKGGAAVFQVHGLCQLFRSGKIPANMALDCVGPEFADHNPITWLRHPLDFGKVSDIKVGLVTSLGFGHVSGLIAVVNPGAFEAALLKEQGQVALEQYIQKANARLLKGYDTLMNGQMGKEILYSTPEHRRFKEDSKKYDSHEVEAQMLITPEARLGLDGTY